MTLPMPTLTTREKNTLITGIVLAAVFVFIQFVYLPLLDERQDLERILASEKHAHQRMEILKAQYRNTSLNMALQQKILETRPKEFTLFSFLDAQAEASGVKAHIDYMRPDSLDLDDGPYTIAKIRLKLKAVYLNNLTEFIRLVETSENGVQAVSLSLSLAGREKKRLDAVMELQTLMIKDS